MSVTQAGEGDLRSPELIINLSSNNPFRNRAASPATSNGQRTPSDSLPQLVSRNPFMDASVQPQSLTTGVNNMAAVSDAPKPRSVSTGNTADLFNNLNLKDNKQTIGGNGNGPSPSRPGNGGNAHPTSTQRRENVPPRGPSAHRPSSSREDAMRARRPGRGSSSSRARPTGELDIFADPPSSSRTPGERRPRRNSDSSAIERNSKSLDSEDEKKRHERRRRERKQRERDGKGSQSRKSDRKLDVIDKLDVTSIYGTGLFHHDGPFDACNPHRNRQGSKRAPMQAFPKDSLNNILGGGGPLNNRPDHATFLGNNDEEAFKDYSKGGSNTNEYEPYNNGAVPTGHDRKESNILSATTRVEPIHGEETLGLGTSTFLEGAPASRTAMQRRESEASSSPESGLGRKKSLAQKIRGINAPRREYGPRITSPDGILFPEARAPGGTRFEKSPFDEFASCDDSINNKKESGVTIVEPEKSGEGARAGSNSRFGGPLERRLTTDGNGNGNANGDFSGGKIGTGFLNRVKSLKGGPRKVKTTSEA